MDELERTHTHTYAAPDYASQPTAISTTLRCHTHTHTEATTVDLCGSSMHNNSDALLAAIAITARILNLLQ